LCFVLWGLTMENSPAFEDKSHYEDHCIWIATLSNDQTVYQDDWNTPSAFERMRDYCRENQLFVRSVLIRFRSHVEKVYDGEGEGFFFRKAILGALFSDKNF